MSLLHPTLGEMMDRLIVLKLKRNHCEKVGIPMPSHLEEERLELHDAVCQRGFHEHGVTSELLIRFREVHEEIWSLAPTDSSPALLAANKRRWELREAIDKLTGEWKGPEKV